MTNVTAVKARGPPTRTDLETSIDREMIIMTDGPTLTFDQHATSRAQENVKAAGGSTTGIPAITSKVTAMNATAIHPHGEEQMVGLGTTNDEQRHASRSKNDDRGRYSRYSTRDERSHYNGYDSQDERRNGNGSQAQKRAQEE